VGRDLVKQLYRLGRQGANGVLTIDREVFVLRRGAVMCADGELAKRALNARLARLVAIEGAAVAFAGGVMAYPPGAQHQMDLAGWARSHLEAQLDGSLADTLVHELAGIRLSVRSELAPEPHDEADRRMLLAMAQPRRLDQIWPLARTPRFRLLAFLHFLRSVDALAVEGIAAARSLPVDPRRRAALRLLGVPDGADREEVKRAYRRLARALHPDLQPDADADHRRTLELRFAEITAAYESLV